MIIQALKINFKKDENGYGAQRERHMQNRNKKIKIKKKFKY